MVKGEKQPDMPEWMAALRLSISDSMEWHMEMAVQRRAHTTRHAEDRWGGRTPERVLEAEDSVLDKREICRIAAYASSMSRLTVAEWGRMTDWHEEGAQTGLVLDMLLGIVAGHPEVCEEIEASGLLVARRSRDQEAEGEAVSEFRRFLARMREKGPARFRQALRKFMLVNESGSHLHLGGTPDGEPFIFLEDESRFTPRQAGSGPSVA